MQSAVKEKLLSYFQHNYQYEVPFFQRAYVWDEESWELLYEHIATEVEAARNGHSEHFIGTIITKQLPQDGFAVQSLQLVDGQQRLTTVSIALKALADTCTGDLVNLRDTLMGYLSFRDSRGAAHYRIKHSRVDGPYFEEVMGLAADAALPEGDNNIVQAYRYFRDKFDTLSDEDRDLFANVILQRLPVIAMFLGEHDDEQEIFDTINSLGVRLSVAELLKNYVFRDKELKDAYETLWSSVFEDDEEEASFWGKEKTAGRVKRTNLELLLYTVLIIETGKEVRLDKLFNEYKAFLKDKETAAKRAFLERLKAHAETYREFPGDEELNEIGFDETEKRVFHVIEYLEITTVYPLLLFLYDRITDRSQRVEALVLLESYLVRRVVAGLTSKNYNRLFIQMMADVKKQGDIVNAASVRNVLASYEEDTNRFPNDAEFKRGFHETYLYNRTAQEVLFIIALRGLDPRLSDRHKLSTESYSVEHMLPKKWREHWRVPGMTEEQKAERDWSLKTLGNLTLVTQPLNSTMRNSSWSKKRKHLKEHSHLSITKNYLDLEAWDESTIIQRANDLGTIACKVWATPVGTTATA